MGEINANDKRIKGIIIEAGGDVKQDGIIRTGEDSFVGIKAAGKYESNNGQIIQENQKSEGRINWGMWGTVVAIIIAIIGWLFFSPKSTMEQNVISSPNSINTIGQTGGTNSVTIHSSNSHEVPIAGVVDGVNRTFVWTNAPTTIVVDSGRFIQKVSSDGTVNWTGATTTILTIAPTFDIYGQY